MDENDQGAQMEPLLPAVRTGFIFHVGSVSEEQWHDAGVCVWRKTGFGGSRGTGLESITAIINPPPLEDSVF